MKQVCMCFSGSQQLDKLANCQSSFANLVAQEAWSQNSMQGYRKRVDGAGLGQDNVAASLTCYFPARSFKKPAQPSGRKCAAV